MPSAYENLLAAKASLTAKIAAAEAAMGPNVSVDGQAVDKVGYLNAAYDRLAKLNALLAAEQPSEFRTEVL